MLDILFLLVSLFCALILLVYKLKKSGFFDNVEVTVSNKPPILNQSIVIFYKRHVGAYKHAASVFKEVSALTPSNAITFGIYYDDPELVKPHLLQSAIGVVYGVNGTDLYPANYAEQLTRWGYERMTVPAVQSAVVATQRYDGFFSMIALTQFTYSKIKAYIKMHNLNAPIAVEFFENDKIHLILPLEQHDEFLIPQLLSVEDLETQLARRKWDSDEGESCSEDDENRVDEDDVYDSQCSVEKGTEHVASDALTASDHVKSE
ncbi:unnamed protein product [Anisakis simplex]|uniref:Testis-expressed sequence 264 protein (inferred by orthology to a human protein) n=1 Tax=Anisakis simplex TaxID=6269 RepID=A0A0M3JSN3_ANISI|nr:unnamed protein product [Anisakis simplex]